MIPASTSSSFARRVAPAMAALMLALTAPAAHADARQDTERAEAAFRTGDLVVAMTLLRKAAEAGHAPAQARYADLLDAAEQDVEAVAWYRKAAEQGEPAGEFGLGRMHANGEGVKRDPAEALKWYRLAAGRNHVPALDALARAYRAGDLGLAKDPAEAQKLEARIQALSPPRPAGGASR